MSETQAVAEAKVKTTRDGDVAILTLSDPATMNAAGVDMAADLTAALKSVVEGPDPARAVVLTGEGRGFCSGANLTSVGSRPASASGAPSGERAGAGDALKRVYNPLILMIRDLPIPIVTAVNGAAAGVGCSLALMGDLIVAGESAYFLQAFRRIGLIPDGGSTYLLPRMIGRARAMEMTLLGERLPAAKALEWGLINRCVPDAELIATALALAQELARGPKSLSLIRRTMWASLDADFADQLNLEADTQNEAGRSQDFVEGVQAFLQKRPAVFKGK
ncbi:MAG TPA: enoyl-CoA hydratase/isomerase [Caulobacteraceae bacterium]|jgi:2-(1,2-epoxy-1,2-dihydrophenyl)acetyl-CoA isomerase|nr:enoyl-CoA hydratase/isomerase [Caulobacteraceae bacterium]